MDCRRVHEPRVSVQPGACCCCCCCCCLLLLPSHLPLGGCAGSVCTVWRGGSGSGGGNRVGQLQRVQRCPWGPCSARMPLLHTGQRLRGRPACRRWLVILTSIVGVLAAKRLAAAGHIHRSANWALHCIYCSKAAMLMLPEAGLVGGAAPPWAAVESWGQH